MNPTTTEPPFPQLQPPQPPQPHRPSTSCDRHPDEHFTGFCPSCLCERLAVLDQSSSSASSSKKPPSSSTAAAIKAIFKPELRRTKSFTASKNEGFFSGSFEPQRKSCDVRVRSTLWSLFSLDDDRNPTSANNNNSSSNHNNVGNNGETEPRKSVSLSIGSGNNSSVLAQGPVLESKEEEESEPDSFKEENIEEEEEEEEEEVFEEPNVGVTEERERVPEIIEEEEEEEEVGEIQQKEKVELFSLPEVEEFKTMKDHIDVDLDSHPKKASGRDFKDIAGSFWSAASVFSKKLQKWRRKQKLKKQRENGGGGSATLPVEKPIGRQFRETQSEIADYGFGRRSCDTDPRFSLDMGRISFDDPRYSFDEPRASWDGCLIGRSIPRMAPMVSVVEDSPVQVSRIDTQIPVEEPPMNCINEDEGVPGGSAQTRDYYLDSSSRRRKSLDRSNSIRKTAAAVVAEMDELKSVKNAKVSPATAMDYYHGTKVVVSERELRDSNSNSLRDDCSETFDFGFRDNASIVGNGDAKGSNNKKSKRWGKGWSIWGFINRRGGNKDENDDRYSRVNGVERSFSESWQDLRGDRNGDIRGSFNRKVLRSNSSVSSRNSYSLGGSFVGPRKNGVEMNGNHGKKKRDEFVLERNRSARYSPNNLDNGLLRFYLTPMRGSRRGSSGKSRVNHAHSIARSVLRLY